MSEIAHDLAGLRTSDPLPHATDYYIEARADDVIGVLAALDVERASFVGTSLGGDVAVSVLRRTARSSRAQGLGAIARRLERLLEEGDAPANVD